MAYLKQQSSRVFISIVVTCSLLFGTGVSLAQHSEFSAQLLSATPSLAADSTQRFYRQFGLQARWSKRNLAALVSAIAASESHGLTPVEYHQQALLQASGAKRDILATDAYLALAGHLLGGKLNPISIEPTWTAKGRERDLVAYLHQALESDAVVESLTTLAPQQPRYQTLLEALERYRRALSLGGWEPIAAGPLLKPGMHSERVTALRNRLKAIDGSLQAEGDEHRYDSVLVSAVKRFQQRANLEPDGIVGPDTLAKLNLSPQDLIDKLRVNLERWRWLPEDLGRKHIRVNIANYHLETHEGKDIRAVHDVVVGRTYRQTPIFSASMSYLVLNPWWETPSKLARKDLLPKFQRDPSIVQSLGYQILDTQGKVVDPSNMNWNEYTESRFPFRVRQQPGPMNALGQVKFMFPNSHDVYLHDTPSRDLFSKTRRDFSSGCIRVRNPIDLVEWVIGPNPQWSRDKLENVLSSGKETTVKLTEKIPVHLLYWTVVADDDNDDIRFVADIYQRDQRVLLALNKLPDNKTAELP
ncbi:L,D-transpeptidase family protein [Spongiibacter nanhainus]|uniref:L,D-transpeptidase family protein n=1 Tax=Spongiibacter nanhainus TaxID=2794344 RepID=UPI001E5ACF9F|nr:L,D-transpeptidase family protein [Spongiibacter nanhainus]